MSPSTKYSLPRPAALDVVPASEVGALIERTDREFTELEARAAEAAARADEAEQLARAAGVDPKSSTWTMVRLQRFLDTLRAEVERDSRATLEVARQRARMRMAEATSGVASAPLTPMAPSPTAAEPALPVVADEAAWSVEPGERPAPPPPVMPTSSATPPVSPASVPIVHPRPEPPAASIGGPARTNGHGATLLAAGIAVAEVAPMPSVVAPAVPAAVPQPAPSPAEARVAAPPAPAAQAAPMVAPTVVPPSPVVAPAPAMAPTVPAAPTAEPATVTPASKKPRRKLPVAAILEVLAVLLVLVFILMRLS